MGYKTLLHDSNYWTRSSKQPIHPDDSTRVQWPQCFAHGCIRRLLMVWMFRVRDSVAVLSPLHSRTLPKPSSVRHADFPMRFQTRFKENKKRHSFMSAMFKRHSYSNSIQIRPLIHRTLSFSFFFLLLPQYSFASVHAFGTNKAKSRELIRLWHLIHWSRSRARTSYSASSRCTRVLLNYELQPASGYCRNSVVN